MNSLDAKRKGIIKKLAMDKEGCLRTFAYRNCSLLRAYSSPSFSSLLLSSSIIFVLFCCNCCYFSLTFLFYNAEIFGNHLQTVRAGKRLGRLEPFFQIAFAGLGFQVMEIGAFKSISSLKLY